MSALDRPALPGAGQAGTRLTRRNPPGAAQLSYQGGDYAATLQRMLARLATLQQLARLNPDAMDDWTIALLHASAVVTDVLSFYQERVTNEGYFRTAVDRRSVLELARAIGYELRPGIAATAYLALTIPADDKGQPQQVTVPKGSAVQSVPGEGKLPQIFESSEDTVVRSDWNLLRPVVSQAPGTELDGEPLRSDETTLRVANYRTDLRPDDVILLTDAAAPEGSPAWILGILQTVEADPQKPYTLITWKSAAASGDRIERPQLFVFRRKAKLYGYRPGAVYFNPAEAAPAAPGAAADPGHWTPRTLGLPNTVINALVVNAKGVVFAGTQFDVFRSADDGVTWKPAGVNLVQRNIMALAIAPDGALVAGSNTGGIYISRDDAENWTAMSGDTIAPDSSIEDKGSKHKVVYDQILPKAPVRELEVLVENGKTVTYAGTDKGIFRSYDDGKIWEGPLKTTADGKLLVAKDAVASTPAEPPPAPGGAQPQPAAIPVVAVATTVTLARRFGQFFQKLGPWLRKLAPAAKALGFDILGAVTPWFAPAAPETPINALAVDPSGKKPTLFMGTDAGKFRLQGDTRRWLWVAIILALVMLSQFLTNRGRAGAFSFDMTGSGTSAVKLDVLGPSTVVAATQLAFQGSLKLDPPSAVDNVPAPLALVAQGDLTIQPGKATDPLVATGGMTGHNFVTGTEATTPTVTISGIAVLTLTAASGVSSASEITKAITAHVVVTTTGTVTANASGPVNVAVATVTVVGVVEQPASSPVLFPWVAEIWQTTVDLLQNTVIASINAVQNFLQALWAMIPEPLKTVLMPVYDLVWGKLLKPIFDFINTYLVQPLLNYTAATLAQASLIALAVWLLLKAWQWLQQKYLNRAGVRIDAPVNTLLIRDNGQIFAGTTRGIYRSLENDPQTPLPTRITRMALRALFTDRIMRPANMGLTANDTDPLPDIRALTLVGSGALLAGSAGGRIFRSIDNGSTWSAYDAGVNLKAVRMIVPATGGVFVAGVPGANAVEDAWFSADLEARQIDLNASYDDVKTGTWIVLVQDAGSPPLADGTVGAAVAAPAAGPRQVARYAIGRVDTLTARDFGAAGAFTRITAPAATPDVLGAFLRSKTDVLLRSEPIALFDNRPVGGATLHVQGYRPELRGGHCFILTGKSLRARVAVPLARPLRSLDGLNTRLLAPGELLSLVEAPSKITPPAGTAGAEVGVAGDPDAAPWRWHLRTRDGFEGAVDATRTQIRLVAPGESDPVQNEIIVAAAILPDGDHTELRLVAPLARVYDRATVSLFGNIVETTHGSTVTGAVIGSGNGMQANQRFVLPEKPLTYLSAATESGLQTTLEICINGILWQEVPSLFEKAPGDRVYIIHQGSDENTAVIFGDGKQGARLPTGTEHVTATYRTGSGPDGNIAADALTQLQNFPAAVQKATNPLPAGGGTAAEETDHIRDRTPLSVRGLGRIVALPDYADFAQTFAGIGRVRVATFGEGKRRVIHLTLADTAGNPIGDDPEIIEPDGVIAHLRQAIDALRSTPTPPVMIQSYEPLYFDVIATLVILPNQIRRVKEIERDAHRAMLAAFSFAKRDFGQTMAASEVVAVLSAITGVCAVKETTLRLHAVQMQEAHARAPVADLLTAQMARHEGSRFRPAQMLLLNPTSQVLNPMMRVSSPDQLGIRLEIVAQNALTKVLTDPTVLI